MNASVASLVRTTTEPGRRITIESTRRRHRIRQWTTGDVAADERCRRPVRQRLVFKPFLKITPDRWEQILAMNLTGTLHSCQAFVPHMIDAGSGRNVNISSVSAQTGNPLMTHNAGAKAGVVGFAKTLAAACAFLVCDDARYITRQVLGLNGGRTTV